MDVKKSLKINYRLGSNYLLFPTFDGWVLMRSGSYRPIMNSNDNTEEQLEEFVKEHREYNALVIMRVFALVANLIVLGLCFANIYIHSELLSYFVIGAIVILIPTLMIISFVGSNNRDTYQKVLDEDMEYYSKAIYESEKKKEKSTRAKRGRKKSSEVQK